MNAFSIFHLLALVLWVIPGITFLLLSLYLSYKDGKLLIGDALTVVAVAMLPAINLVACILFINVLAKPFGGIRPWQKSSR